MRNSAAEAGLGRDVSVLARTIIAVLLGALALAGPASASQVLEYQGHGRLVPRELGALPKRSGPESAAVARRQACRPFAPRSAPRLGAAGTTVRQAIARARKRGTIGATK